MDKVPEDFEETVRVLKSTATTGSTPLTAEALQLLLDAYGRRISVRLDTRRELVIRNSVKPSKILSLFNQGDDTKQAKALGKEIESICAEALTLLEKSLIPTASDAEEKAICLTM